MLARHESLKTLRFHFEIRTLVSAISSVVTCACTVPIYRFQISWVPEEYSQLCNNSWIGLVGLSRL